MSTIRFFTLGSLMLPRESAPRQIETIEEVYCFGCSQSAPPYLDCPFCTVDTTPFFTAKETLRVRMARLAFDNYSPFCGTCSNVYDVSICHAKMRKFSHLT